MRRISTHTVIGQVSIVSNGYRTKYLDCTHSKKMGDRFEPYRRNNRNRNRRGNNQGRKRIIEWREKIKENYSHTLFFGVISLFHNNLNTVIVVKRKNRSAIEDVEVQMPMRERQGNGARRGRRGERRGRGFGGRGRGRGFGGRGRGKETGKPPTVDQLDADLDTYWCKVRQPINKIKI